jgi:hypothetical protein
MVSRPDWFLNLNREFIPNVFIRDTNGKLWLDATLPYGCTVVVPIGTYKVQTRLSLGEGRYSTAISVEVQVLKEQIGVARLEGFEFLNP